MKNLNKFVIIFLMLVTVLTITSCKMEEASNCVMEMESANCKTGMEMENSNCAANSEQSSFTVKFNAEWSSTTHPKNFPSGPHFSPLVGATHNNSVVFWNTGSIATNGIEVMAETGGTAQLESEIKAKIKEGNTNTFLRGSGINPSPGCTMIEFSTTAEFPLLTLFTMIAPSPDWFLGIHGVNLRPNGNWIDTMTIDLYAYDSGTDSGTVYASSNSDIAPHIPIVRLPDSTFVNSGEAPRFGTFVIQRKK